MSRRKLQFRAVRFQRRVRKGVRGGMDGTGRYIDHTEPVYKTGDDYLASLNGHITPEKRAKIVGWVMAWAK